MRIMIFTDFRNFCASLQSLTPPRIEHISGFSDFILDYVNNKLQWNKYTPRIIRHYVYDGEYTTKLITRIKKDLEMAHASSASYELAAQQLLDKSARRQTAQQDFMKRANSFDFLELKYKPLQYQNGRVFQKGVDVQLAVDLVSHAYLNSYDVAIICSGDVDLIESIKLVKNLGKKVIVASCPEQTSTETFKACDHYINFTKLMQPHLDKISKIARASRNNGTP